jgi:hypothetical protein
MTDETDDAFDRWLEAEFRHLSRLLEGRTAQGIDTRSASDAKRRGPKGESPVAESDAPSLNNLRSDEARDGD